jgi:hypothetical protein
MIEGLAWHRLQVRITDQQYRALKQRAGQQRSMAAVIRGLIDESVPADEIAADPSYRHIMAKQASGSEAYHTQDAMRDVNKRPS